ncbi:MAG: histidinol-phosphate transaminase [Sedimentisphaerales bacterium]|nr:histidinol-phosphate transaminase [Sedimentisphaerales bacterium]
MSYFRENIERAAGYKPGFQPKSAEVVKLNTNENPYPPSPAVMKAIADIQPEQLRRYPDPMGNMFREAAAKINGVEPDWILCCNGGDDLLRMAFAAFCDKRRPVAYPVPTYSLYPVLANIQNCKAIEVKFDEEFNLPARLARIRAALMIVCNPNAPSGTFVGVEEIAELAAEVKGVLLIDEAYVDFAEQNCTELVKQFGNVIILRSLSKGYSLAGLRFGYAIAQPEMIAGIVKVKDSYNVGAIAIAAATAAIKDQEYFRETIEKVKFERKRLIEQLRGLGFTLPESSSNFVFAEHKTCRAKEIYDKLVQQNIYVRYWDNVGIDNKLRITVGMPEQDDILLSALKEIVTTDL